MGLTVTLDPTDANVSLHVREDADWGVVPSELQDIRQGGHRLPRVAGVDRCEVRVLRLPVVIDEDDADDVSDVLTDINKALGKQTTLVVQDSEASNSVTFRTYPSPGVDTPTTRQMGLSGLVEPVLSVNVEPYTYGTTETLVDEVVTSLPAETSLAPQSGEYETPLEWEFALSNMTQLFLAVMPPEFGAWAYWLRDANDYTWSGADHQADAAAAGGVAERANNGAAIESAQPVTNAPQGEYACLVRARMVSGEGLLWCSQCGAGEDDALTIENTSYEWHDLGRLVLPTRRLYGSGTATATIHADPSGSADMLVDQLAFLRVNSGFFKYDGPACDNLASDGEHVYVDGKVNYRYCQGSILHALGGRLQAIVEVDGSAATYSPTMTLAAEPRHNLWR